MVKISKAMEPPEYLRTKTKKWFKEVVQNYMLESHHIKLLTLCCEALDTAETAREEILEHGAFYKDRYENPRANPAINVARDSMTIAARLIRELNLDTEPPKEAGRPPGL